MRFKPKSNCKFCGVVTLTVLTGWIALTILSHYTASSPRPSTQGWLPFPVKAVYILLSVRAVADTEPLGMAVGRKILSKDAPNISTEQKQPIDISTLLENTTIFSNSHERKHQMDNLQALISNIRRCIPPSDEFLLDFKNPCWYADNRNTPTTSPPNPNTHLQCLPYFFLLGYPKAGSSKLYSLIMAHHEYALTLDKEVSHGIFLKVKPPIQNTPSYLKHFGLAAKLIMRNPMKAITSDGTPTTVLMRPHGYWSDEAPIDGMPMLLQELLPNAKYLVIIRNPLFVTRSAFYYTLSDNAKLRGCSHITEQPATVLHELVYAHIQAHRQCVSHMGDEIKCLFTRYYTKWLKPGLCGDFLMEYNVYYSTMLLWLKHIPRERFHFVYNDELERNPLRVVKQVYEFLGMSPLNTRQWELLRAMAHEKVNSVSFLDESERTNSSIPFMKQETVELLKAFYQPFNEKLAALIGDKRFFREWDYTMQLT